MWRMEQGTNMEGNRNMPEHRKGGDQNQDREYGSSIVPHVGS